MPSSWNKQHNRYVGTWTEPACELIDLPWSKESLRTVLSWGATPASAPHTHQEIAHWCDRLTIAHLDTDDPPDMEAAVRVAADVDCQWDIYLANTYSLEELKKLDFRHVQLPLEWFHEWIRQLDVA